MWKVDRGTQSGTTAATYTNALDWKTHDLGAKTILLKNTDGTASLKYRLLGYVSEGGIARELVAETTLLAGEVAEFHYDHQWHSLLLVLKDGTGHAAYAVDYEGQGV